LASSVVIRADVLDKAQRHAAEQAALLRVSKAAASGHQLRTALADIASASLGIAGAERCTIELWRPITDETLVLADTARDDFVDQKYRYTKVHSDLVCETAVRFGQDLGLPPDQIEALEIPGQLYDVGKIAVPDAVLRKPGYLSENDRHIMQQHVVFSELMVKGVPNLPLMLGAIVHHHERWDGTGYPYRKRGVDIPLLGRIMALADAYSAMVHDRPYRKGRNVDAIINELRAGAGTQFDPELVEQYIATVRLLAFDQVFLGVAGLLPDADSPSPSSSAPDHMLSRSTSPVLAFTSPQS